MTDRPNLPISPARPPLPVLPLEHEVRRDTRASAAGIVAVLLIAGFGVLSMLGAGVNGAGFVTFIILAAIVAALVTAVLIGLKFRRPAAVSSAEQDVAGTFHAGGILDYQRPLRDPRKLSPRAFFGQAIG